MFFFIFNFNVKFKKELIANAIKGMSVAREGSADEKVLAKKELKARKTELLIARYTEYIPINLRVCVM